MSTVTKLLLAAFVVLGLATMWYLNKRETTSLSGADYDFSVKDTASIGKIFIADRANHSVTLTRNGDHWMVNGKYRARTSPIRNVLTMLHNVTLKYRLPRAAVRTAVKDLATLGIKVEVYNRSNKLLKAFYIGGPTPDERASYMVMEGSNEPYVAFEPLIDGALSQKFFSQEVEWRDRTVFQEDVNNIAELSVDYPSQKDKSFRLTSTNSGYTVTPFYPSIPRSMQPYKKGSAESYLVGYNKLGAEGFELNNPYRDSISAMTPFAIISIKSTKGDTKSVSLHPIVSYDKEGKPIISDMTGKVVVERYYANCSWGDFMMVQDQLVKKYLMSYQSFFGN